MRVTAPVDVQEIAAIPVQGTCPGCAGASLVMRTLTHEVPHFGEALQTLLRCDGCGFRFVDFIVVHEREPVRYTFRVEDADDLAARVIRSSSGTIRIPEIGLVAEPSPQSESYVSNVEGVLQRIEDVFQMARRFNLDDPAKVDVATAGLARIEAARQGDGGLTLIIEDPWGNSAIVHERAEREPLTDEEANELKTGIIVIDKSELAGPGDDDRDESA